MKNYLYFVLFIIGVLSIPFKSNADEEPDPKPIDIGKGTPTRPKAPGKYNFELFIEGNELIIESSRQQIAEINILDYTSGHSILFTTTSIFPEYHYDLSMLKSGAYEIIVIVNDQYYSELIYL